MPEASSLHLSKLAGSFVLQDLQIKKEAMGCSFLLIGTKRKTLSMGSLCGCPLNYTSTLFRSTLISYIKGTCLTQRELIKPVIPKANGSKMGVASNEKEEKKKGGRKGESVLQLLIFKESHFQVNLQTF